MIADIAATLDADRAQIEMFVSRLFRYADGGYVQLRAFRDDTDGTWESPSWPAVPVNGTCLARLVDAAFKFADDCAKAPVPVVFAPSVVTFIGAQNAAEIDVANGVALSVECDRQPVAARQMLESLLGPATVVMASGGEWTDPQTGEIQQKLHLHWRLTEPTREPPDHRRLKEARLLATRLAGADGSAVPPSHPMRWAGSWHRKNPACPRPARIIGGDEASEIDLTDALERLQDASIKIVAVASARTATPTCADERLAAKVGDEPIGDGNAAGSNDDLDHADDGGEHRSSEPLAEDMLDVLAALSAIPNHDVAWVEWNRIGMAIWRATGGSELGYAAFAVWSAKSSKFESATTRARWDHYAAHPTAKIGAGTLFHKAKKAKAFWRKPSDSRKLWMVEPAVVARPTNDNGAVAEDAESPDGRQHLFDLPQNGNRDLIPLRVVAPSLLHDKPVPERRWLVRDWIPDGVVTGLYGPGGLGKT